MKLKKVHLSNYRNFKDYQIEFGAKTTIFIGKNGMGKTNIISALKQSLSFIFSKKKDEPQYEFIASSKQLVKGFAATDARYCNEGPYGYDYKYPVSIETTASLNEEIINWRFYSEYAKSGVDKELFQEAKNIFWNYYLPEDSQFPVLAFFADSYPHIKTNIGKDMQEKLFSNKELPKNTAFFNWDEEKNCTEIWVQYFTMQWKNHKFKEDPEKEDYIDAIIKKMIEFSLPLHKDLSTPELELDTMEIEARGKNDILIMSFKNGDRIPFQQLPQGYKRIFSIVFDIANRSYILNHNCNPSGIVFIDELELHLHPSIAQEILERLQKSFPNIQFIVSTHSPLVITNFKQNEENILYKLYKDGEDYKNERVENLYGVDYNSGLRYSMDTPERDTFVRDLIEAYEYWKEADNEDMMNKLKEKIKEAVGVSSHLYQSLFE